MKQLINIVLLIFLFHFNTLAAQDSIELSVEEFLAMVATHHPIAMSAKLEGEKSEYISKAAKGNFDPQLEAAINEKYFESSQYYTRFNGHLRIPTYWGIQAEVGYTNNQGIYLNPEETNPENGLLRAGISLSLGKGLIIDERRAILRQARIYSESTEVQRKQILNSLLYEASIAYYKWYSSYYKLKISIDALNNASLRLDAIKKSVTQGFLPGIDTVEARLQWQNIYINRQQAALEFENNTVLMETFMWFEGITPLEMDSFIIPSQIPEMPLYSAPEIEIEELILRHPDLLATQFKVDLQEIDVTLKKESLKPTVDLKWQALSNPNLIQVDAFDNYQSGAYLSYPIFTRNERSSLKLSRIKLEQLENDRINKEAELKYKIQFAINLQSTNALIWIRQKQALSGYALLLDAESSLYLIGESSLFKLNVREMNYIKAQKDWIDAVKDFYLSEAYLNYSTFKFIDI